MMKTTFQIIIAVSLVLSSCQSDYKFTLKSPKKIQINKTLILEVNEAHDLPVDSVKYSIDNKHYQGTALTQEFDLSTFKLGKHVITALVFADNKTKKLYQEIYFLSDSAFEIYDYEIINTYPHDAEAFTQGLEYHNGYLYETTGQHGESSLRKVELKTGKVVQQVDLDEKYFGEGMTIFNDEINFLTWRSQIGMIYDLETFELKGTFDYGNSKEGWGLTHDGTHLIKSDGTERLYFLDPVSRKELSYIEAYTNTRKAEQLNELEYVEGFIYANIWQRNSIVIVEPSKGAIVGIADLSGLKKMINSSADPDQVLNGIAYDKKGDRLFVTGKNWNKLFEIELIKRD
ncbi:MAG: glutaminyl-peptide cyclotransferase [Flavobacteriaceae bacterium]